MYYKEKFVINNRNQIADYLLLLPFFASHEEVRDLRGSPSSS